METFLTKTMTIVALICFLVVGAAATAILGRDSVPAASPQLAAASAAAVQAPVSNKENKKDRLAVVSYALAAYEPPQTTAALSEPLRQAYASTRPADIGLPKEVAPARGAALAAPPKPKAVAKPQPQKNYALLSDVQIAGIKDRLKLSLSRNPTGRRWKPRCAPSPARFMRAGRPTRRLRACRSIPNPQKSSS
jgi:hypothetical protein